MSINMRIDLPSASVLTRSGASSWLPAKCPLGVCARSVRATTSAKQRANDAQRDNPSRPRASQGAAGVWAARPQRLVEVFGNILHLDYRHHDHHGMPRQARGLWVTERAVTTARGGLLGAFGVGVVGAAPERRDAASGAVRRRSELHRSRVGRACGVPLTVGRSGRAGRRHRRRGRAGAADGSRRPWRTTAEARSGRSPRAGTPG